MQIRNISDKMFKEEGDKMAHARRRQHYRIAQKAAESQECQHEKEQRRNSILLKLVGITIAFQIFIFAIKLYECISCRCSESELN